MADGKHTRVCRACERCRVKKIKCDGEFPCKRCKEDGMVCAAGRRKKTEYKQMPPGYAEVLESTQFALIATIHKLYAMVRNGETWNLDEPDLNDRGQPVVHNIVSLLGCIRRSNDIDLPVHSIFPEDDASLAELVTQLEAQQKERDAHVSVVKFAADATCCNRTDRARSSELDHCDLERDYWTDVFDGNESAMTPSPQSLSYDSFDSCSTPSDAGIPTTTQQEQQWQLQQQPPASPASCPWWTGRPTSIDFGPTQFLAHQGTFIDVDMVNQELLESEFATIVPHMLSCPNRDFMMSLDDPMTYFDYDADSFRARS